MVKVQGERPNPIPGEPTEVFSRGEAVGIRGLFAVVRGAHDFLVLWAKLEGDRPVPVAEPSRLKVTDANQGVWFLYVLYGTGQASPGNYGVGIIKVVGDQGQPVAIRRFVLR